MLSDEEWKAIDKLKRSANYFVMPIYETKIILELIEKQSKEIEELKDFITKLQATKDRLDSYDKENTLEIEKLKKEIEELTDKNKKLKDKAKELTSGLLDSTQNDKIKAKIQECREILYSFEKELELKAKKDKFIHKESMNCLLGQISILQSLLEKE